MTIRCGFSHLQLACFRLGPKLFAIDIMRVREILVPQHLSGFPRASDLMDGVLNLRGSVIPVMNMRKRFGMPPEQSVKVGRLMIVSLSGQLLALQVDEVMEVIEIPVQEIKPPIQLVSGIGMEFVLGVCIYDECVFMILDIDSLLTPADLQLDSERPTV